MNLQAKAKLDQEASTTYLTFSGLAAALTRARDLVIVVGSERAIRSALHSIRQDGRLSYLLPRLQAISPPLPVACEPPAQTLSQPDKRFCAEALHDTRDAPVRHRASSLSSDGQATWLPRGIVEDALRPGAQRIL